MTIRSLKELFWLALEVAPEQRIAWLQRECPDSGMREQLELMLSAHEVPQSMLDRPVAADLLGTSWIGLETTAEHTASLACGMSIGPYKLLELIGEGGMGTVFMAEQTQPMRRRVALKLIKPGMDSRQVIARFEAERQALTLMDDPNIARVLDAGTTDSGRPYFVMELVKGQPITQYCDEHHLTPRQRLELLLPVFHAIQHAHQKGIVHRDIKPSNILVAEYDQRAVPKVIDFGVAKAIGSPLTETTVFTGFGQVVGTLEYMSPEQAKVNQLDIDTRSDIYSLGVLMYELLTGSTPFDKQRLRSAAWDEMLRIIREEEPPAPSTKLSSSDSLPSVSANRNMDPIRLSRCIRGELDWIVMKALEKDRNRRYPTANSLAMDVQRYLADEAVEAGPPSYLYRLKKFVRRNKRTVIAAAMVLIALVGGIIGTSLGFFQANVQRERAESERRTAIEANRQLQLRAAELKQVSDFQARMLSQVDPYQAGLVLGSKVIAQFGANLAKSDISEAEKSKLAKEFESLWSRINKTDIARSWIDATILQQAITTLDKEFTNQPLVKARLKQVLGLLYIEIGRYEQAIPLLSEVLETHRTLLGEEHPDTLDSISAVGVSLVRNGQLDEAERYLKQVLELQQRLLGYDHEKTLTSMSYLAELYRDQGKWNEATAEFRKVLEKRSQVLGEEHPDTLETLNTLGTLLITQGDFQEAESCLRRGLAQCRKVLGNEHNETLSAMVALGGLCRRFEKFDESEALLSEAVDSYQRVFGEEHQRTLSSINSLALLYQSQQKYDQAEPLLRKKLEISRRVLGENHPRTLNSISNLANMLQSHGRPDEAEPYILEALEKRRRFLGPDHADTLLSINELAVFHWKGNRLDQSIPLLEDLLERSEVQFGRSHLETQFTVMNLGANYMDAGRWKEAMVLLEEAFPTARKMPAYAWVGLRLLSVTIETESWEKSNAVVQQLLSDVRERVLPDSLKTAAFLEQCSDVVLRKNRYRDSVELLQESLSIRERLDPNHGATFGTQARLGASLLGNEDYEAAEPTLLSALQGLQKHSADLPPAAKEQISECIRRLIELYRATGNQDQAEEKQMELDAWRNQNGGSDSAPSKSVESP